MTEERFIEDTKLVARLRINFLNSNFNILSVVNEDTLNEIESIKITGKFNRYSFI